MGIYFEICINIELICNYVLDIIIYIIKYKSAYNQGLELNMQENNEISP